MSLRPQGLGDERRLDALRNLGLLDTPAEEAFDRLTRLAVRILGVPVALVTLVDEDRQFFKSCVGLPEPWASRRETPLTHSFCQHTVTTGEPLVIEDAREHPTLRENLAVPNLNVVAYAGIPLATSNGLILGSFCAIDVRPRCWTADDIATLRDLAASAASEIELRLTVVAQRRAEEDRRDAEDASDRRLRLLAESGRVLSSSLDLDATLEAIARLTLPALADMAVVDLVEDDAMRRVAAMHADPAQAADIARTKAFPPRIDDASPQAEAIRTGRSVIIRDLTPERTRAMGRGEGHVNVVADLAIRSVVVSPLQAGREVLGTLSLTRTGDRPAFTDAEVELAEELARRAALAVQNARLYEEAKDATRARDHMLGVVSHDLRNPIHTIYMSVSFLQDILPPEGADARTVALVHDQARVIKRSAERANRLIGDLLDLSRIASGQLSLDCRSWKAAALADEALEHARLAAEREGIVLERGPMDETLVVRADRDRVLQALGNLLANALKFTPRGGRVTVSVARDAGREGPMVRLTVADTGAGIAPEHVHRLFDQFWQANRKDKRGVGLGLSIVKGIAEGHGGEVRVETAVGQGSAFSLLLPLAD